MAEKAKAANPNMKLWDSVCMTDPADTKEVSFGRKFTAIDPYKQIRAATAKFGPAGDGWGWSVERVEYLPTNEVGVLVRMWHRGICQPGFSIDQWGQASLYIDKKESMKDKDCMKKATTDGITKCLSLLGFNADIFLGQWDDNKYVQEATAVAAEKTAEERNASCPIVVTDFIEDVDRAATSDELSAALDRHKPAMDKLPASEKSYVEGAKKHFLTKRAQLKESENGS
jgi:hypothetical protein